MKIYFAGSIRGGRDDREIYSKIINLLNNYGEILTEHLGDSKILASGEKKEAKEIYERDLELLKSADVIVAEVTTPSLGVGYELGIAQSFKKKILCLYRPIPQKFLSAMIAGNELFKVEEYSKTEDLTSIFNKFFNKY